MGKRLILPWQEPKVPTAGTGRKFKEEDFD